MTARRQRFVKGRAKSGESIGYSFVARKLREKRAWQIISSPRLRTASLRPTVAPAIRHDERILYPARYDLR
jgi:hypothetical protein